MFPNSQWPFHGASNPSAPSPNNPNPEPRQVDQKADRVGQGVFSRKRPEPEREEGELSDEEAQSGPKRPPEKKIKIEEDLSGRKGLNDFTFGNFPRPGAHGEKSPGRGNLHPLGGGPSGSTDEATRKSIALNKQITDPTNRIGDIFKIIEENLESFNVVNIATAFHKLAKISRSKEEKKYVRNHPQFENLKLKAKDVLNHFESRHLANTLWALATLGVLKNEIIELLPRLLSGVSRNIADFNFEGISNTFWTLAKLDVSKEDMVDLLPGLEMVVKKNIANVDPLGVSNLLWALAMLDFTKEEINSYLHRLLTGRETRIKEYEPQQMVNLLWALVKIGYSEEEVMSFFPEFLRALKRSTKLFYQQEIANIFWAFATLNLCKVEHISVLDGLFDVFERLTQNLNSQGIANLLWSLAKLGYTERKVKKYFPNLLEEVGRNSDTFNSQETVYTFWSFVSLGFSKKEIADLIPGLLRAVERNLLHFKPEEIVSILWAMTILECDDVNEELQNRLIAKLEPRHLSRLDCIQLHTVKLASEHIHRKPLSWSDGLIAAMEQAKNNNAGEKIQPSDLQRNVSSHLSGLAFSVNRVRCKFQKVSSPEELSSSLSGQIFFCSEYFDPESGHTFDIKVGGLDSKFAIQVDGPDHFNSRGEELPIYAFQHKLLVAMGWKVVFITDRDWDFKSAHVKEEILQRKVRELLEKGADRRRLGHFDGGSGSRNFRADSFVLNQQLSNAIDDPRATVRKKIDGIFSIIEKNIDRFDFINVSIIFRNLVKTNPFENDQAYIRNHQQFQRLKRKAIEVSKDFEIKNIANILWALAKLDVSKEEIADLFSVLLEMVRNNIEKFKLHDISNTFWAFAKIGVPKEQIVGLIPGVGNAIRKDMLDDRPQHSTITLWSFATLGFSREEIQDLLPPLFELVQKNILKFDSQHVANTFWFLGKLGFLKEQHKNLIFELFSAARKNITNFTPQGIANTYWSLAKLGFSKEEVKHLFPNILEMVRRKISEYKPQNIANMFWSFATLGFSKEEIESLLSILLQEAQKKSNKFNSQNTANTYWAFAKLGILKNLISSRAPGLLEAVNRNVDRFEDLELANMCWSFAKLDYSREELIFYFPSLLDTVLQQVVSPNFQGKANILWSFATLGFSKEELKNLLSAVEKNMHIFTCEQIASIFSSFVMLGVSKSEDCDFMAELFSAVEQNLMGFKSHEIVNIMWAMTILEYDVENIELHNKLLDRLKHQELSRLDCIQLYTVKLASEHIHRRPLNLPKELNTAMERAKNYNAQEKVQSSNTQLNVVKHLSRLFVSVDGTRHKVQQVSRPQEQPSSASGQIFIYNEYFDPESGHSFDIKVNGPSNSKLAIEVDGPGHFNSRGEELPIYAFQRKLHAAMGWNVVHISYREWDDKNDREREEILQRKFQELFS